jgi:toxin ParE1/3/4
MNLVIADEARDDLARIAEWIARGDPRRAIAFIDEIEAHCERIAADPLIYPLLSGHDVQFTAIILFSIELTRLMS